MPESDESFQKIGLWGSSYLSTTKILLQLASWAYAKRTLSYNDVNSYTPKQVVTSMHIWLNIPCLIYFRPPQDLTTYGVTLRFDDWAIDYINY